MPAAITCRPETRVAILAAAETIFARYGFRKTTVDDIAKEAGLSRATVYLYFASKEEIAVSWIDCHVSQFCEELSSIGSELPPDRKSVV